MENGAVALDRICFVPFMFQLVYATWVRVSGHAKVTGQPGGHAQGPLAGWTGRAYLCALPDPYAEFRLCRSAAIGAPSHGLK